MVFKLRNKAEHAAQSVEGLMIQAEHAVLSLVHGGHPRRKSGNGESFWQFRDYSHDDEPRLIDWRQSAKGTRVYVKQKEWETAQNVLFWCLNSKGMDFSSAPSRIPTKLETAQIFCLALALLSIRNGENIGSIYTLRAGHSEKSIEALGDFLMERSGTSLPDFNQIRPVAHAQLVLCGDFLEPLDDIAMCLRNLAAAQTQGVVVQVLDPAELDLPYQGRVEFIPADAGESLRVDHVSSVREMYQKRLTDHNRALAALCRDLGWVYYLHRTDQDLTKNLQVLVRLIEGGAA